MPRTDINYSNGIIYKLCCKDPEISDIYIGSTTEFRKRKYLHKSVCNNDKHNCYNLYVYSFIRENGDWDNWEMIEVEKYQAFDKQDLLKRERYWLEELKASLNKYIPFRSVEETKDKIKEYRKEYNEKNKDIIKDKTKEYYEKNKDIIKDRIKEYREQNKDKIKEYHNAKYICECGKTIRRSSKSQHEKTKTHNDKINP